MRLRTRWLLASVTLLLNAGCFFNFNNPVVAQFPGSIAGQVVLNNPAPGQTLNNATVSLLWSGLSVPVGMNNGNFLFLNIPDGTFTLRYDVPAIGANDFPYIQFRYDLLIPANATEVDAINLGVVSITPSGRVVGNYTGPEGVVVAAFTPDPADGGTGSYEGFSTTTNAAGHYSLLLPAGDHLLSASAPDAGVEGIPITIQAGQVITEDLTLATQSADCAMTAYLVFGGHGVSAPMDDGTLKAIQQSIISNHTVTVVAEDGTSPPLQTFILAQQEPYAGMYFTQPLASGHSYTVTLQIQGVAAPPGYEYPPLVLQHIPAVAGRVTRLGQVAWLRDMDFCANGIQPDAGTNCASLSDGGSTGGDGGGDAGTVGWELLNFAPPFGDGGSVYEVAPLPIGDGDGGVMGHRLAWVQADGLVYSADDVGAPAGGYNAPSQPWIDAANPTVALTGATTSSGGAAFAWAEPSLNQVTVAYYPPGSQFRSPQVVSFLTPVPPSQNPGALALVPGTDSIGNVGLWVLVLEQDVVGGLLEFWFTPDFVTYTRAMPTEPAVPLAAGQIAGAPCQLQELDGGNGICIAATVNWTYDEHWAYGAVLNTHKSPPVLSVQLIVDAGSMQSFGPPAIEADPSTSPGVSNVTAGWALNAGSGYVYQYASFTSLISVPPANSLGSKHGNPDPDGILLPWQGSPLDISTYPSPAFGIGSDSIGTAMPPPFQPGYGVYHLLHGYASNGSLFIAAYNNVGTDLTSQIALFKWPLGP